MKTTAAILLMLLATTAQAWTAATDQRIATKAGALAPPDLRVVLDRFQPEYKEGLQRARADEGSLFHRYFVTSRNGRLRDQIEKETTSAIALIRNRRPMSEVVTQLGVLAHLVADANNPFHTANNDPRLATSQQDFESYLERRMPKFPTVFYGLDHNFQLTRYLDNVFHRSSTFYPLLSEEYFRYGSRRSAAEFDDRSTAFGVASVCYSRSVSDLVNIYYYIWREAGGDVRRAAVMQRGNLLVNAN